MLAKNNLFSAKLRLFYLNSTLIFAFSGFYSYHFVSIFVIWIVVISGYLFWTADCWLWNLCVDLMCWVVNMKLPIFDSHLRGWGSIPSKKLQFSHSLLKQGFITVLHVFWLACFPWLAVCYWITTLNNTYIQYTHTHNSLLCARSYLLIIKLLL